MFKDDEKLLNERLKNRDPKEDGLKNYKIWKKKYKLELLDYNYVHTLEEFSLLKTGGLIRPFSLMTEEICNGGILIKIEKDYKNKWYGLLGYFENGKKGKGVFWRIYFDKYYIFYKNSDKLKIDDIKTERGNYLMDQFISKEEINNFSEAMKPNEFIDNLFKEYTGYKEKNPK
jgi:hypothetical protein